MCQRKKWKVVLARSLGGCEERLSPKEAKMRHQVSLATDKMELGLLKAGLHWHNMWPEFSESQPSSIINTVFTIQTDVGG